MLPRITSCSTNSPLVSRKVLLFVDNAFMTSPAVWARHSEFRAQLREKRLKGHFQPVPISLPVDMRRACAQEFGEGGDLRDRLAGVDGRGQGVDRDAGGGAAWPKIMIHRDGVVASRLRSSLRSNTGRRLPRTLIIPANHWGVFGMGQAGTASMTSTFSPALSRKDSVATENP